MEGRPFERFRRIFRSRDSPYTTIQTTVYRLEGKKAVRRVRKISNAHIFKPIVPRDVTRNRLLDEILSFFGGRAQPMMAQLAEAGKITRDDVRELEKTIQGSSSNRRRKGSQPGFRRGERRGSIRCGLCGANERGKFHHVSP
jgi:BlaI family penicillinase repressor